MRYIPLGTVGKPFGIKGEIRIKPYNPLTEWFDRAEGLWIRDGESDDPAFYRIKHCRRHKDFFVVTLAGTFDRNAAEEMRGREVVVPEDQLPDLEPDEFYWYQLVGLKVVTTEGRELGEVIRMEGTAPELGGNDLFVVQGEEGELLIPATEQAVSEVDLSQKKLVVNPIPGLTDF